MQKILFLAAALATALAVPAAAQVDVALQVGYREGGVDHTFEVVCVQAPCPPPTVKTDDSSLLAATVGIPLGRRGLALEIHASRQATDLVFEDPQILALFAPIDVDLDVLEVGLARRFVRGAWEPFAGFGVGAARLRSDPRLAAIDTERPAASLYGGARYALGPHVGVRLEGRARWLELPSDLGGDTVTLEASAGVAFRIGA